jgi:hypothetical protein
MVIAADAGMLSAANFTALDAAGLSFIVGSRTVKAPADLASHFQWNGDRFADGQVTDTITPRHARSAVNDIKLRAEPVWDPATEIGAKAWRAVWQYSGKRARRDTITLNAQEAKARAVVEENKQVKSTRLVKAAGKDRTLDENAIARARSLVGLKGYVTNIPATVMPTLEVIGKYYQLWHVEQSFRMSKTDLRARPIFHHTRDAIEAHLSIVFAALAVSRVVQDATGLAIGNVIKQLRPLRTLLIAINGTTASSPPEILQPQQAILDSILLKLVH